MQSILYGSKDFGEEPSRRSGVDGDAVVNRVAMKPLLKRHLGKDLRERWE